MDECDASAQRARSGYRMQPSPPCESSGLLLTTLETIVRKAASRQAGGGEERDAMTLNRRGE